MNRRTPASTAGKAIGVVVLMSLSLFPFYWMVSTAVDTSPLSRGASLLPSGFTLDHFRYVLDVTNNGSLTIQSLRQRLVLGKVEIPLPRLFQGLATVIERYDDEQGLYHIHVTVRNPLIGRVFSYEGTFAADENA